MPAVRLTEVTKTFARGNSLGGVSDLNLFVPQESLTTIIGPNAAGKTTTLNLVAGLLQPDAGSVVLENVGKAKPCIGYVWQDYRASLLPWLDTASNVCFPLKLAGVGAEERRQRAEDLLRTCAPDVNPRARSNTLSGGQQQKLAIARSLISLPDVLLLDEPFSALDHRARLEMGSLVERLWLERPMPTLLVSHDIDEALMLGDQILLLRAFGSPRSLLLENSLPRPRTVAMLTAPEHLTNRAVAIEFLYSEPAASGVYHPPDARYGYSASH